MLSRTRHLAIVLALSTSSIACGDSPAAAGETETDGSSSGDTGSSSSDDGVSAGTTTTTGTTGQADETGSPSVPCAQDEFVGADGCVQCPPGTTNDAGDDPDGQPTECDAVLCDVDAFVDDHVCVACGPGTINEQGDDAAGDDTACDAVLCGVDQRVEDHACTPCPAGTTNRAGDDASGKDTACDASLCASNEHVQSNACVACPPGTDNDEGDDPSGDDTPCDSILCEENEFVEDNACWPCPKGTTNESGDDASGPNTACLPADADPCELALGVSCEDFDEAYLKASNTASGDEFGWSIAMDGDTLVVGTHHESTDDIGVDGSGGQTGELSTLSGAVHVFRRVGTSWQHEARIKATNPQYLDQFGTSVALSGDTLVVGAENEDSAATGVDGDQSDNGLQGSGAAYVFHRTGSTWTQEAYLKASNTGYADRFGISVAIVGNTIAVGATMEDSSATGVDGDQSSDDTFDSGAVYVFERTGATWSQAAYIKASNPGAHDRFGRSLAMSEDTLVVGASGEDSAAAGVNGDETSNAADSSGAVYVFERSGDSWAQQAYIKASNPGFDDGFGFAVTLSGETLAVGAYGEGSSATGVDADQTDDSLQFAGAVYVFERTGGSWAQQAYLKASTTGDSDHFGASLSIDGDTLAVGAHGESSNAMGLGGDESDESASNAGAVFLFRRTGSSWTQAAYLKASNTDAADGFARSVALLGNRLAIGGFREDSAATGVNGDQSDNTASGSGAVYVRRIAP
ncbi:MAG: hypothetical protein ACE37F_18960 [Nannocystaceae bacterium]|nr:FG-GAP repeat protein [bacterium]